MILNELIEINFSVTGSQLPQYDECMIGRFWLFLTEIEYDLKDVKLYLFAIDHVVFFALHNPKKGGDKQNEESF
jgi:hypothetical protein